MPQLESAVHDSVVAIAPRSGWQLSVESVTAAPSSSGPVYPSPTSGVASDPLGLRASACTRIVLWIDDQPDDGTARFLALHGIRVEWATTGQAGLDMARKLYYDATIVDLCLPDMYGLSVIERLIALGYRAPIIGLSGIYTEAESVAQAQRLGATAFWFKPMFSEDLLAEFNKVVREPDVTHDDGFASVADARVAQDSPSVEPRFGIVAISPVMRGILEWIDRVGPMNMPVLLTGETGTGKELVAHALHARGVRAKGPFVAINCGAISEGLWETEFFGHRRGAFTNAFRDAKGLIEQAASGTLFLDEVGDLPIPMQVKLLRFLDDGEVRRVGEERRRHVEVRVIAATNRFVLEDVRQQRFRDDLYYRLAGAVRHLPALRERPEDIDALVAYWLRAISRNAGRPNVRLTPAALTVLRGHSWPGNVRELRHVLETAVCLAATDQLTEHEVSAALTSKPSSVSTHPVEPTESDEANRTLAVLEQSQWNRTRAARLLGINRKTLWRRIHRLGIGSSESRNGPRRR